MPVHALQDQRIIAVAHHHGLQRHTPLARSDGTALQPVPSCNRRGCARWREGSSHCRRRCGTRCGRWRTAPRSGWRQKRRLSRHGEASAEPVVRRENLLVVSVVSSASRPQGRWSPPTGGRRTDPEALQAGTAAREERMHPQPRQRDRREWRDDPTRTNTSGRSHHVTVEAVRDAAHGVPVEGHRHSPPIRSRTGARSQTRTGTHALGACTRPGSLPELPPHTAPAPSPLSGAEKDSTTAARIVAGSRRNESVRSRHRQRVRHRLAAHHARVASSVRLSVNSLLAWMSLG